MKFSSFRVLIVIVILFVFVQGDKNKIFVKNQRGPTIFMNFDGEEAINIIYHIASVSNKNIVVSQDISVPLKLKFEDVHWYDALESIAKAMECKIEKRKGNIYWLHKPQKNNSHKILLESDSTAKKILQEIGILAKKKIVIAKDVGKTKLYVRFSSVHWRDALDAVLNYINCNIVEKDNTITVYKNTSRK